MCVSQRTEINHNILLEQRYLSDWCQLPLPPSSPQTMCSWPRWRWTPRERTWRTMWPGKAAAAGGPSLLLGTTGSRLSDRTCTWTCTRPLWSAQGSPCRRLARTASPLRWPMKGSTAACIRDLSVTCRPPLQPYLHALDLWVFASNFFVRESLQAFVMLMTWLSP